MEKLITITYLHLSSQQGGAKGAEKDCKEECQYCTTIYKAMNFNFAL